MRVTAETKGQTRKRILDAAIELFRTRGFEAATTRDLASAAGIATGTVFNYFPNKESIVAALAEEALAKARACFSPTAESSLEEDLFALVAGELRNLKTLRKFIPALLETSLSPLVQSAAGNRSSSSDSLRTEHLEIVASLARKHGLTEFSPVALQLYWTLYTGVLAFWAADKSPKQEDTLALLDQSLAMFVAWLEGASGPEN
ncbi:MAG TPA: TetR/AcrR family transcriptional regulator [Pirellulales bacterium]|nr:TetR/AcrR family transcriptional regulator [Pirellulales bacterium]